MSSKEIDIQKKCPEGTSQGPCEDDSNIEADKGDLQGTSHYGYVTHSGLSGQIIKGLTYDGRPLRIKNGKTTAAFAQEYPELEKVTTYYYTKNDGNSDHIKVPLILRVRNKGGAYHLYINKGGDHTKWEKDSHSGQGRIPAHNNTTPYLTKKLTNQTCRLYRLHRVDLHKSDTGSLYGCDVCSKAKVTVKLGAKVQGVYTKIDHIPTESILYHVTYKDNLVRYQDLADHSSKSLYGKKGDYDTLSVYYWEGDDTHDNPLLIELKRSTGTEWYENIDESGGKHDRWRKLDGQEATNLSSGGKLKTKLDCMSCIFNGTVQINLGRDSGCHTSNDHRHRDRLRAYSNGTFDRMLSLSSCEYKPRKESCANGLFHVSEIHLGDNKQTFPGGTSFFKNVNKVSSYTSSCDLENPFLLCIEYAGSNEKYKWYWKKDKGDNWEKKPELKDDPENVKGQLGNIFLKVKGSLGITPCPPPKSPPPDGLKLFIAKKPTNDQLFGTYDVDSSSGKIPIAVVKTVDSLVCGFFRVTHKTTSDKEYFKLNGNLEDGDTIREGKSIPNVREVSVYFWEGAQNKPILLGINQGGDPKYYSYYENRRAGRGKWLQGSYSSLKDADLSDMLDDQNCYRNSAIPVELTNLANLEPFYKTIMEKTGINPYLSKIYVSSSKSPPTLPPEAQKDYEVKSYDINREISRVTYGGKDTDIEPPGGKVSHLRLYKWRHEGDIPLLVEFVSDSNQSTFFENLGKNSLDWASIGENEDDKSFYADNYPLQGNYTKELMEKLDEVSCRLHHTVKIDISIKGNGKPYCHGACYPTKRIKVINTNNNISGYTSYEHTSSIQGQDKFTVTSLWNSKKKQEVTGDPLNFPLRDVESVIVYFSKCDKNTPIMIYIDQSKDSKWLKNEDRNGKWTEFHPGDNNGYAIKDVLEGVKGNLRLCKEPHSPLPHLPAGNVSNSEARLVPDGTTGDDDSDSDEEDDVPEVSPAGSPQAQKTDSARETKEKSPDIKTISIITSSVLVSSGSLTGFALWISQRFAGEPWVRQI